MSEIERLRGLLAEGTPGPWRARKWASPRMVEVIAATKPPIVPWSGFDDSGRTKTEHDANAALVAAAVNALPALLDVAEAAGPTGAPNVPGCTCDRDDGSNPGGQIALCPMHVEALLHLRWDTLAAMVIDYQAAIHRVAAALDRLEGAS